MDIVAWLWWFLVSVASGLLSLVWLLIGGWVSTLLQLALLILVIYFLKYGWQRAPAEIWRRSRSFARFFAGWIKARDPVDPVAAPQEIRIVKVKELGDINVSTLLSLLVIIGLVLVARI
jgi:hypothetical protein